MDMGVCLAQAYLRVHGYFTVSEYPILEAVRHVRSPRRHRHRYPGCEISAACQLVLRQGRRDDDDVELATPDAALAVGHDQVDMIIGEVKIGTAELNRAATNPAVLRAALMRFGCCDHHDTGRVVDAPLRAGHTTNPAGHNVRMVAFGSVPPSTHIRRIK